MNVLGDVFDYGLNIEKQKQAEAACSKLLDSNRTENRLNWRFMLPSIKWLELTAANAGLSMNELLNRMIEAVQFRLLDEVEPDAQHIEPFAPAETKTGDNRE